MNVPSKTCVVCGRTIEWRKKWAASWDDVKYCSDGCRKKKHDPQSTALEHAIETLLDSRSRDSSICPSDAAKAVAEDWRPLMEPARQAARRLVAAGKVEITQHGHVVDPSTAKGPIRIRRPR